MTETPDIISRLRAAADASGPTDALLVDACDLLNEAADHIEQQAAARRAFLERAVCHPGPPMSETEDYDPDADLSELEGSVLERMDMETRFHRELMEIRREAEGILVRTPDPSRSTVQVFKDLLAHFVAFHQHLEEQVASTKRAALGLIRERRVIADDRVARAINTVAMLRRRCERYEGWWALPPAQRHPLGPEFSDGVGSSRPDLAEIEQIITNAVAKRYPNGGHHEETLPLVERVRREIERGLAPTTMQRLGEECRDRRAAERQQQRDAVAEHIRAAGGNPEAATVAQIADALNATSEGVKFTVNAAGDGVNFEVDQKSRVRSIKVVGGDRVADLGLAPPAVKLQWDSPDTFEVAPPKRITIDLRRPATPPTPAEEVENAVYMARMMEGVKQAGAARPEWPLMPLEIVMQIGFATFKPEATSVIWAGQVISTGDADLSLQMENPVHELSVFNFEDSMGRVRKQSGKGRMWLALDDAAAERLGFYCGAGLDGPVSLTLLWPSSDAMRFEVRLHGDALDDDEGMPKTRAGDGKAWHGYQIEVCPYPGPAADLFQARNRP